MTLTSPNKKYNDGLISTLDEFLDGSERNLLDVGCKLGNEMFPFIDRGFKKLVGLDIDEFNKNHIFRNFLLDRNDYSPFVKIGEQNIDLENELQSEEYLSKLFPAHKALYDKHFEFRVNSEKGNIFNYESAEMKFDLIIISKVLHFYNRSDFEKIIDKLMGFLSEKGLIYIAINNYERFTKEKSDFVEKIERESVTVSNISESQKWYFYNQKFINSILEKFSIVEKIIEPRGFMFDEYILRN